jgi:hypothetical protein
MEKVDRNRLLDNTSTLMSLQLRRVVEQSIIFLRNSFLYVPRGDFERETAPPLHDAGLLAEVSTLHMPAFMRSERNYQPFIRLNMVVENDGLRFQEGGDNIRQEVVDMIRNTIVSCDRFLHPRNTKLYVDPKVGGGTSVMRQV